jgi:diphthine-ammonia ligase
MSHIDNMKVAALLSGGKDSLYALGCALKQGHSLVCVANLYSPDELDSYMFQTVGTLAVPAISQALDVPLIARPLIGKSLNKKLEYERIDGDEIEDLYELLLEVKYRFPNVQAVVSGAVQSDYQRLRVEQVCNRLGFTSISPLWRVNQTTLLRNMLEEGYESIIVKISAMGLMDRHLGEKPTSMIDNLVELNSKYGFNVCGEGGEYETLIIDAPIMKKKIVVLESNIVPSASSYNPNAHINIVRVGLQDKAAGEVQEVFPATTIYPSVFKKANYFITGELTAQRFGREECYDVKDETFAILRGLKELLRKNALGLRDIYYVTAYLKDMNDYAEFNKVYAEFFCFPNPPSRVCVETSQQAQRVKMIVWGSQTEKKSTHVQSISSWAPANIGPYSQAYRLGETLHLAGSIPLEPLTLTISADSLEQTLKNSSAIASVHSHTLDNTVYCVAYYTTEDKPEVPEKYRPFYVKTTNLPKNAPLELEFHLKEFQPSLTTTEEALESGGISAVLKRIESTECVYFIWSVSISRCDDKNALIELLREKLSDYFSLQTYASPTTAEEMLELGSFTKSIDDYIYDFRIYSNSAEEYTSEYLSKIPAVRVSSSTEAILIFGEDLNQLYTINFISREES